MQKNPAAVMKRAKEDPELRLFLEEFMGLMGDHFTNFKPENVRVLKLLAVVTTNWVLASDSVAQHQHAVKIVEFDN